jgi:hypothetical protein
MRVFFLSVDIIFLVFFFFILCSLFYFRIYLIIFVLVYFGKVFIFIFVFGFFHLRLFFFFFFLAFFFFLVGFERFTGEGRLNRIISLISGIGFAGRLYFQSINRPTLNRDSKVAPLQPIWRLLGSRDIPCYSFLWLRWMAFGAWSTVWASIHQNQLGRLESRLVFHTACL